MTEAELYKELEALTKDKNRWKAKFRMFRLSSLMNP